MLEPKMATIKLAAPLTDIHGSFSGVYYHRDRAGLHACAKPRHVHKLTAAQAAQRNAFIAARAYSTDPRFVSYNIYRVLNGLEPADPPADYSIPDL